ncbi:MAG TPA: hypothetical protein ENF22_08325 [Chloroflexi bacterium]|nr:hypothetical protein [Chloroflexota bacterium]
MINPILNRIKGNFLFIFLSTISATCRFEISGIENLYQAIESGKPLIGTSWHGMTMMVIGSLRKYIDLDSVVTIIPDDYRGDILEIFANKIGIYPDKLNLDGDNSMETSRKLLRIIRQISSGRNFLIHPDGPADPAYVVKPGLTAIAQKTGALIMPMGGYCRHAYHWDRWDRYTWPLPFSKIQLYVAKPFTISRDIQDLSPKNQELEIILNKAAFHAAADYYEIGRDHH